MIALAAAVSGLIAGSFASVAISRWPRGPTVAEPRRSRCESCGVTVTARDNVPVASWLMARGRCRSCRAPMGTRPLVVELVMAALFAAIVAVWGLDPLVPALLVLTWGLVVASAIDVEHRIIPNRLTLRLPLVLAPLVVFAGVADGDAPALVRAGLAAVGVPAIMLAVSELFRLLRGQPGIGMGDVKLAISLGMVVGYVSGWHLLVFAYASILLAVVVALALVAARRAGLASRIPFGPYLACGALVAVLSGDVAPRLLRPFFGF